MGENLSEVDRDEEKRKVERGEERLVMNVGGRFFFSRLRKLGLQASDGSRGPNNIEYSILREPRVDRRKWKSQRVQKTICWSEDLWKECDTWVINKSSRKGPHGNVW